jgi:hypothetical protein
MFSIDEVRFSYTSRHRTGALSFRKLLGREKRRKKLSRMDFPRGVYDSATIGRAGWPLAAGPPLCQRLGQNTQ